MKIVAGAAAAVLTVGAGAAAAVGFGGEPDQQTGARDAVPAKTAKVTRATLTQTASVDGTLGYGPAVSLATRGGGTVTWLPAAGSTVGRGQQVLRADDKPVVLLLGNLPLYRTLKSGLSGADVAVLEQNLAALGYTGFEVDDEFDWYTGQAVKAWQEDLGLAETGTVDPAQVVVTPAPIRVASLKLGLGDPATGPVLTYTGTTRRVDVDVDVADQHLVRKGAAATVELPDGTSVAATVSSVGSLATTAEGDTPGGGATTVDVTLSVTDQKKLGTLDEAPVTVTVTAAQRKNVLTVPVNALVALLDGGYGVQVVEDGQTRYVAVKTGMFANGRVEISGPDVREGIAVGVPS